MAIGAGDGAGPGWRGFGCPMGEDHGLWDKGSSVRFNRLRLNGFKSFVDPTDLVIHEGLTGVVGPNGCGKSNLLEALRWVMGENRPTAMRGGGMEDVIFAGAATRSARHFAEVALIIDNQDRLAPSGFNEADQIEIVRRITRDAGSAYRSNNKEVRARDVQMLFADASTGSASPALVRQGQISELINAKPKARRRILEEAAGISGLYARRHEAELKLNGAEQNLARVDDVLDQLGQQITTLTRQARQAARYREIGSDLRRAEGMLLFRRWREADLARTEAEEALRQRLIAAAAAETAARQAVKARGAAEEALPGLREQEAIAAAILQRLILQRDALSDQEVRAQQLIQTLRARIEQEWEIGQLFSLHEGHEERLLEAADIAHEAASLLSGREIALAQTTEDAARLSARHQSAERMMQEARSSLARAELEATRGGEARIAAEAARLAALETHEAAIEAREIATEAAEAAEEALLAAEEARADVQSGEAEARAARSSAEGEANALRAEVTALARLVARESKAGTQLLDLLQVEPGFEQALGAALADDLRQPALQQGDDLASGWAGACRRSVLSTASKVRPCKPACCPVSVWSAARVICGAGMVCASRPRMRLRRRRCVCSSLTAWSSLSAILKRSRPGPRGRAMPMSCCIPG
jgi:chromosome segregation protein